ncbi:hypothetical protein [Cumulibacter soli]|uniref:hypothetical protein n=1 Tax=Cumulibacter soli TaxID=2546344 RepID=UPI001ABB66DC|nr:hypothetical protein [Cumulibacter soli]
MTEPHYEVTTGPTMANRPVPPNNGVSRPPATPRRKRRLVGPIVGAVGLLLGAGIALAVLLPMYSQAQADADYFRDARNHVRAQTSTATETIVETETLIETETETVTATPSAPPEPEGPATTFGSGTYLVGVDIAPGTYLAPGGTLCYWERLAGLSGDFEDIIANGLSDGGQVYVEIDAMDVAFKTEGCGTWEMSG